MRFFVVLLFGICVIVGFLGVFLIEMGCFGGFWRDLEGGLLGVLLFLGFFGVVIVRFV